MDESSQPVDSALVRIYRTSDNFEIGAPQQYFGRDSRGQAVIFDNGKTNFVPNGQTEMQIKVVLSKGLKSATELYVISSGKGLGAGMIRGGTFPVSRVGATFSLACPPASSLAWKRRRASRSGLQPPHPVHARSRALNASTVEQPSSMAATMRDFSTRRQ
jgi:hypothetical protein